MENLGIRQKRVKILKERNINISEYRKNKNIITIIANKNFRITEEQLKSIKMDLLTPKGVTEGKLTKYFKIRLLIKLNKILTNKGILVRMGKGKGKVKTNVFYLTQGKPSILLIPNTNILNINLITKILKKFCNKYTFFSYRSLI